MGKDGRTPLVEIPAQRQESGSCGFFRDAKSRSAMRDRELVKGPRRDVDDISA